MDAAFVPEQGQSKLLIIMFSGDLRFTQTMLTSDLTDVCDLQIVTPEITDEQLHSLVAGKFDDSKSSLLNQCKPTNGNFFTCIRLAGFPESVWDRFGFEYYERTKAAMPMVYTITDAGRMQETELIALVNRMIFRPLCQYEHQ